MTAKKNNDEIQELEKQLKKSEEQLEKAFQSEKMDEWDRLIKENYRLQRKLSLAKGEETALLMEWNFAWDTGAPSPYVMSHEGKTILIYYIALVEFIGCYSIKFGGAYDGGLSRHPLYGKGLEWYEAHIIENSRWIQEEMKIESDQKHFNEELWKRRKHLLFVFHDEIFECITESYKVEVIRDSFANVVLEAQKRCK